MLDFKNKSVLITGGTGSLGKALTKRLIENHPEISRLIIYSRDEQKQFQMSQEYPESKYPQIRFFVGDVRDKERLTRALKGVSYVIHAAAMKHVHIAEYNPDECIKTNVGGAQNLVEAAIESGVSKIVALSTDKACAPINLYGATKLCSDKLFIAANNIKGSRDIKFSVVRYGNVMGSRGSVIPYFLQKAQTGVLPITNPEMTRFNISLKEGVEMVIWALEHSLGGELLVPKIPSYRIVDVADAISPNCQKPIIGIRPGEKIHEEMITTSDSFSTIDLGNYYAILPSDGALRKRYEQAKIKMTPVKTGFAYNSGTNNNFLSIKELRDLIKKHVDAKFEPYS